MDSTKQWFNYLHLERKLSVQVIGEAKLAIKNNRLEIPVLDKDGVRIFSKYRKEPWDTTNSPKYLYEQGGVVSLYGIHFKSQHKRLYLTEGEIDVLSIRTAGFDALTSTGGTLSWQQSWQLDRLPIIIFDNDDAGIKGTIRTALLLGKCVISWVPTGFGKDVSDVLQNKGKEFLYKLLDDPGRQIHIDLTVTNKKEIIAKKKELQGIAKYMDDCPGREIIVGLAKKMLELERAFTKNKPTYEHDDRYKGTIERAKAYPIDRLIPVVRKMARCPFHADGKEKTPSFHVKDNKGFCFGGCDDRKPKDAIDIYMKINNCDIKTAVKALT